MEPHELVQKVGIRERFQLLHFLHHKDQLVRVEELNLSKSSQVGHQFERLEKFGKQFALRGQIRLCQMHQEEQRQGPTDF
jgi:hypothetical protein